MLHAEPDHEDQNMPHAAAAALFMQQTADVLLATAWLPCAACMAANEAGRKRTRLHCTLHAELLTYMLHFCNSSM